MNKKAMKLLMHLCILTALLLLLPVSAAKRSKGKQCSTCKSIVEKFKEGLKRTAKAGFGGGNTQWEEKSLGNFATSETRLVDIMDHLCEDNKDCHALLEQAEDIIEDWWFNQFANRRNTNLQKWMCVKKLLVCCPKGTFGPDCEECEGGREKPCSGHGKCDGDGTREGTGECKCHSGYTGEVCDECDDNYYADRTDGFTCKKCHAACDESDGCSGPEPKDCKQCADGWTWSDEEGCKDIDECAGEEPVCSEQEYCQNNPGTYVCLKCHPACEGCTGTGPENCKACKDGWVNVDGVCEKEPEPSETTTDTESESTEEEGDSTEGESESSEAAEEVELCPIDGGGDCNEQSQSEEPPAEKYSEEKNVEENATP